MGEKGVMNYDPDCDALLVTGTIAHTIKYFRE